MERPPATSSEAAAPLTADDINKVCNGAARAAAAAPHPAVSLSGVHLQHAAPRRAVDPASVPC